MTHLVIITPKAGSFAYLLSFSSEFKKHAQTSNYAYFTYVGKESSYAKVCELLSSFNFKEFSLDKENNYYRFKVHVE